MTDIDISIPPESLSLEYPHFTLGENPFIPLIFDGGTEEKVPPEFNTVRLPLDGSMKSDLSWNGALEAAEKHRANGLKILWDVDLGLFSRLALPISDETQFRALKISLTHFCDHVWERFADDTLGICVYRGNADFSRRFPWNEKQREFFAQWKLEHDLQREANSVRVEQLYCRDTVAEYLHSLVAGLPGNLQVFLVLDTSTLTEDYAALELVHREVFDGFYPIIKGILAPQMGMSWDSSLSPLGALTRKASSCPPQQEPILALCLPSPDAMLKETDAQQIAHVMETLSKGSFRIVSEAFLPSEWHGLDYLIVAGSSVSSEMFRRLQGFCAAGGTVVTYGPKLGLDLELAFDPKAEPFT